MHDTHSPIFAPLVDSDYSLSNHQGRMSEQLKAYYFFRHVTRVILLSGLTFLALVALFMLPSHAHEVWLLTPAQVAALVTHPQPALFLGFSPITMLIALIAGGAVLAATMLDRHLVAHEVRLLQWLPRHPEYLVLTACRLGVGILCISAALGMAPRYGTPYFTNPTLFVSDLDLTRFSPEIMRTIQYAQIGLGLLLILNLMTRFAALGVIVLIGAGLWLFDKDMLPYLGHMLAPAGVVAALGSWFLPRYHWRITSHNALITTRVLTLFRIAMGLNFIYLAIAFKIQQPNLLIAIIEGAGLPTFGFSVIILSYIMGIVEFTIGVLIVVGVAVRPATLAAVGAMVFFMIVLREPPHVHANIIGAAIALLIMGSGRETVSFQVELSTMCQTARDIVAWARRSSQVLTQKLNYGGLAAAGLVALAGLWTPVVAARADLPATLFTRLPSHQPTPHLELKVERDASGHIVLDIDAQNFIFAALCTVPDEQSPIASGHAHIYVNNIKKGMISLPQKDLGVLPTGRYRVTVSLNDARHRFLVSEGHALMVTRILHIDPQGHIRLEHAES